MVRYITAQYIGAGDDYYVRGRTYPLAVKTRFFSKKVSIYKRRGYYDAADEGSLRDYTSQDVFHENWSNIQGDSPYES